MLKNATSDAKSPTAIMLAKAVSEVGQVKIVLTRK